MNVALLLGLTAGCLLIGVLIGLSVNGRAQIERDKRQAVAQQELNLRENRLRAAMRELRRNQQDNRRREASPISDGRRREALTDQ
jgi:hypothetical protein